MTDTSAWSKPTTSPTATSDLKMLAQVEQWMAVIREIDRDDRAQSDSASARLEHLLTPTTD